MTQNTTSREERLREKWREFTWNRMKVDNKDFGVAMDLDKDVSDWWLNKFNSLLDELLSEVDGMKLTAFKVNGQQGEQENEIMYRVNKALEDVIAIINHKKLK